MAVIAAILIGIGVLIGLYMLTFVFKEKHIPKGLALLHGAFVGSGLIVLLIYATTTASHHKHWDSILIFVIAAMGGIYVFERDIRHKQTNKYIILTHGLIGLGGFIWLLTHLLH